MKRPYLLYKRDHLWYYRLAGEKTFHTTGQRNRNKAEAYVVELLRNAERSGRQRHLSFRRYAQTLLRLGSLARTSIKDNFNLV